MEKLEVGDRIFEIRNFFFSEGKYIVDVYIVKSTTKTTAFCENIRKDGSCIKLYRKNETGNFLKTVRGWDPSCYCKYFLETEEFQKLLEKQDLIRKIEIFNFRSLENDRLLEIVEKLNEI